MNWDLLLNLAAVPAVFAVLIYVLGHLLSTLLNKPDIKKYVEAELINIVFIMVVIAILPGMDLLATQFTQYINPDGYKELCAPHPTIIDNGRCHIVVAGYHLEMMSREMIEYYSNLFMVQTFTAFVNGLGKTDVVQGGKGVDTTLYQMFTAPVEYFFRQMNEIMILLTFIELSQLNLVWIITDPVFFESLLILGIILRLIPPLKLQGGLLMAIAIALYYIYPMAIVLVDAHYRNAYDYEPGMGRINRLDFITRIGEISAGWIGGTELVRKGSEAVNKEINKFGEIWATKEHAKDISYFTQFLTWTKKLITDFGRLLALTIQIAWLYVTLFYASVFKLFWIVVSGATGMVGGAYTRASDNLIPTMFNMVSEFMLIIAVLTYLSLISTIAFIKSFSPLIGGDVEIAGITKLI